MKLIQLTPDHYIVVDDTEVKENDWYIDDANTIRKAIMGDGLYWAVRNGYKKITRSTKPIETVTDGKGVSRTGWINIGYLSLSEVKELLGEVDVENKAREFATTVINPSNPVGTITDSSLQYGFEKGYNQCLEDNKHKKYTEEDMRKAFMEGNKYPLPSENLPEFLFGDIFQRFFKHIQPKTQWEVEFIDGKLKLK